MFLHFSRPKRQGLLPSNAQKRWLQEVKDKLSTALSEPLLEPPSPSAIPRELLLKHDPLRLAAGSRFIFHFPCLTYSL